ncbi:MAG: lipopolysaccharide biosynthesis protein [Spirochaetales bacterium]|jgi:O-antigen/teichoic acid export membrane protein
MSLKQQIFKGAFWTVVGQMGSMIVTLLTNIVLARLLTPYEFGQMGILMFFIVLANIFTESGFGGAIIRKKDVTKADYSTMFVFNLIASLSCYILLIAFSGIIARYYHDDSLKKLFVAIGIVLVINALTMTQNIKLVREMRFKNQSIILLFANIFAATTSIIAAYYGLGIWALVLFQVLTSAFNSVFLIINGGFFFSLNFDRKIFKELYGFGVNTTTTSLIGTAFDNIYQVILGRYFSLAQVGFYFQAKKLQTVPFVILNAVVQGVAFSSLSKLQENKQEFIKAYNKLMLVFTILMGITTTFIYLYANSLIIILFGKKWIESVFFMQLLSVASFFYFQELINNIIFKVFNQTKKILYLEIVKKAVQVISIIIGLIYMDIKVLLYGFVITSAITYWINFYYSRSILGNEGMYEAYSILKVIGISVVCVLACNCLAGIFKLNELKLLYTVPLLMVLFVTLLKIFKVADVIEELKGIRKLKQKEA